MNMADSRRNISALVPFAFEVALGVVGAFLAWLAGVSLDDKLWPPEGQSEAILTGVLGTLPLLALLWVLVRVRIRPLRDLVRKVRGLLRVLLAKARWWQIVGIALAAGFGEEILFRGALQPIAIRWLTPVGGLLATSLLFGVVHAATPAYFWFATLVGLYLGGMALWTGEILSASIAHALYDYLAILYLLRLPGRRRRAANERLAATRSAVSR